MYFCRLESRPQRDGAEKFAKMAELQAGAHSQKYTRGNEDAGYSLANKGQYSGGSQSEKPDSGADLYCAAVLLEGALCANEDALNCAQKDENARDANCCEALGWRREA